MFRLEPHQLPPGCKAPLEAPCDALFSLFWKGCEREVALRWVRFSKGAYLLFVRVDGEVWLVTQHSGTLKEAPMLWAYPRQSPRKLRSLARTVERGHNLGLARPPLLIAPDEPQLVLRRCDGSGAWLDASLQVVGEFSLFLPPSATQTHWKAACLAALDDETSDAHFAWTWAQMNDDKRRIWFYDEPKAFNEMERVVRLVLQSADELRQKHALLSWSHGLDEHESWFYGEEGWRVNLKQEAPRLERWRHFIHNHFGKAQWRAMAHHRLVREWVLNEFRSWSVNVEVPRPSAHEQLEARLELRDWLERNVSPQRRRWLLP